MHKPIPAAAASRPCPTHADASHLGISPDADHAALVAEVVGNEGRENGLRPWPVEDPGLNERLLRHGYPVAFPVGLRVPEVPDGNATVDEVGEVTDIRIGHLRRFLRQMPAIQRRAIRLYWGVGYSRRYNQVEVAQQLGLSQATVSRLLAAGLDELRERFGVPTDLAA